MTRIPPLPRLVVLTDAAASARPLGETVAAAVDGGARAVVLREKHLSRSERAALAAELGALLRPVGGVLIVASDPGIAAAGVHLAATDLFPAGARGIVGRACHSPAEVARAADEGCSYAFLSPVFATASKPGYGPAVGPAALSGHRIPVWALGGVDPNNAAVCVRAGAAGVAVMGAVMRAEDPAAVVAELCGAVGPLR